MLNSAIMPHWDDLRTEQVLPGCSGYSSSCGIFTSISGSAPNRIFNIEWRAVYFEANSTRANFEARLYESTGQIDFVYGEIAENGNSATVGVQRDTGSTFTQFECDTAGTLAPGLKLTFACAGEPVGALHMFATPVRLVDTRTGSGFSDAGNHYINDALHTYNIASLAALPIGASAIVARISVVNATASGVIQESPNGPPGAGNDLGRGTAVLNYPAGSVIPSFGSTFNTTLDGSGRIRVRGFMAGGGTVDVIIDISGYFL
jgi:hypothetical protein